MSTPYTSTFVTSKKVEGGEFIVESCISPPSPSVSRNIPTAPSVNTSAGQLNEGYSTIDEYLYQMGAY